MFLDYTALFISILCVISSPPLSLWIYKEWGGGGEHDFVNVLFHQVMSVSGSHHPVGMPRYDTKLSFHENLPNKEDYLKLRKGTVIYLQSHFREMMSVRKYIVLSW